MKKGFTLIELLAVIMILFVISGIVLPITINIINDARSSADKDSAYGIIESAKLFFTESSFDDSKANEIKNLDNIYDNITIGGFKPEKGSLYVNEKGLVALAVVIRDKCYKKEFMGDLTVTKSEVCDLGYIGNDSISPTIAYVPLGDPFNLNGWANKDFFVSIIVNDSESGADSYDWCSGTSPCIPTTNEDKESGASLISLESDTNVICSAGYDKAGNKSDITCSDIYKLDKTAPVFTGLDDKKINKNEEVDFTSGVNTTDNLSGVEGTFLVNTANFDNKKAGIKGVDYNVSDNAGNAKVSTRKITVDADAPRVTYTVQGDPINSNGWSKTDFYVKAVIHDESGLGINSAKWCSTTSDTCNPNADMVGISMTPLISTESNNNKICIQAIDNNNKTTKVLCSDSYKLDKTAPRITSLVGTGVTQILRAEVEDELSGARDHNFNTSSYNVGWIPGTASSFRVFENGYAKIDSGIKYFHVRDAAGNEASQSYNMDMIDPVIAISVNNPTTYEQTKTATITVSDNIAMKAGTYTLRYGWSISSSEACASSNLSGRANITFYSGEKTKSVNVSVTGKDGRGYFIACQDTILHDWNNSSTDFDTVRDEAYMDNTDPTLTFDGQMGNMSNYSTTQVSFTLKDNLNFNGYYISTSATPPASNSYSWTAYPEKTFDTLNLQQAAGTYYFHLKDVAGNTASKAFSVDTKIPTVTVTVPSGATTYSKSTNATITISDETGLKSGGVNVYYTWKDTAYDSSSCSYSDKYVTIYPTQGAKSASANITVTGERVLEGYMCVLLEMIFMMRQVITYIEEFLL